MRCMLKLTCIKAYNTFGAKVVPYQIWVALKDPKTWAFAMMQSGIAMGVGTVGVFLPSFVLAFGYSPCKTLLCEDFPLELTVLTVTSQLFSVIPYACAFVMLLGVCLISDRFNMKGVPLIASLSLASLGYIILLNNVSVHVKVFATCLITSGLYPSVILVSTWVGMNTGGFTKRGTTWALAEISGQSFSILGTHVYTDPPRYIKGHSVVLGFMVLAVLCTVSLVLWMKRENQRKDRIVSKYRERNELHPHTSRSLEEEYDFHVNFRYII